MGCSSSSAGRKGSEGGKGGEEDVDGGRRERTEVEEKGCGPPKLRCTLNNLME